MASFTSSASATSTASASGDAIQLPCVLTPASVRATTRAFSQKQRRKEIVTVNEAMVATVASALSAKLAVVRDETKTVQFPLKFQSDDALINFLAIRRLLGFGTGYEKEIARLTRQGSTRASSLDTVLFGLIGAHLQHS